MQSDVFGEDIKNFPNYLGRKIRFSFNGYGNRIVTDDGPFLARSHDDGSPRSLGKTPNDVGGIKKPLQNTTHYGTLGWSSFYSLQMVTSLDAIG
jgi:hypothetical protein